METKPYEQMDDLGGFLKTPIFGSTPNFDVLTPPFLWGSASFFFEEKVDPTP